MGHPWPLFCFFGRFKLTNNTIFTSNQWEECPSSVRCWDSNPQPLEHESPPITTGPGLVGKYRWYQLIWSQITLLNWLGSHSLTSWPEIRSTCFLVVCRYRKYIKHLKRKSTDQSIAIPTIAQNFCRNQRSSLFRKTILTIGGRITVRLTSCLTGLDSTKEAKLSLIQHNPNKINRRSAGYSDMPPMYVCSLV